jgi:hypothetical protein
MIDQPSHFPVPRIPGIAQQGRDVEILATRHQEEIDGRNEQGCTADHRRVAYADLESQD